MVNRTENEIMARWADKNVDNPVVSVRCLAYNHEQYIAQALDSFLLQETDFPFEIVVHDDASTDGTAEIIKEYEHCFPNIIKPIYESENMHSKKDGSLRRIVDSALRGEYVAICEGDDYWCDKTKLQKQFDFMATHEEYAACTHNTLVHSMRDGKEHLLAGSKDRDIDPESAIIYGNRLFHYSSVFVRRRFFYIPPELRMENIGDYPLCVSMSLNGKIKYFGETMSVYRQNVKGSYTDSVSTLESWKKSAVINGKKMLQSLDKYTSYKYHDAIMTRIQWDEFDLLMKLGEYKKVLKNTDYRRIYSIATNHSRVHYFALVLRAYVPLADRAIRHFKS